MKTQINATIVADSTDPRGNRLTSLLITFPRIILSEINKHRMLSSNTSSSRAIPFKKMVEAVKNNPFIPIAFQKHHSGMQGSEYIPVERDIYGVENTWLEARDRAIDLAESLDKQGVTKQLCNRLLEPFMWTTMLITGSKEGWENFFELRCPKYSVGNEVYRSKRDAINQEDDEINNRILSGFSKLEWLQINKGQAEIHIMDLAEKIYDVMNESTPKQLQSGEWHIPFEDRITDDDLDENLHISENLREKMSITNDEEQNKYWDRQDLLLNAARVKVSTAMAARTSYTVVGDEKEVDYEKMIKLHDRIIEKRHDSPLEHCAKVMTHDEYYSFQKGFINMDELEVIVEDSPANGWCNNFKGFIQYRYLLENQ